MKSVASIESCTQVGYVIREISPVRTLYKQVSCMRVVMNYQLSVESSSHIEFDAVCPKFSGR
jgi:hypothetical protein